MAEHCWQIVGEIEAGDLWAAVVQHPSTEKVDRTHYAARTTLGLWMSPHKNSSYGRFLTAQSQATHQRLGSIVAIPGGIPFHVKSDASPPRRMLHCRLPEYMALPPDRMTLEGCLSLHNDVIAASLARMSREVLMPGFGTNAIVEGLGLVISGELERSFFSKGTPERRGGLAPWQLRRIDEYLRSGNWDTSVAQLARICGVSPAHAMRAFRQSTGRSILSHIAHLRMKEACALLAQSQLAVAQIAVELRFASASGFAAAFRRAIGISPNAYRQMERAWR